MSAGDCGEARACGIVPLSPAVSHGEVFLSFSGKRDGEGVRNRPHECLGGEASVAAATRVECGCFASSVYKRRA